MGDVFIEQLVKKRPTMQDNIKKAFILLGGLIIIGVMLPVAFLTTIEMVNMVAFMLAAGAIYFSWYFITEQNLEFEYIYTNGEIDFDKISAKRKRKRVVTVRITSFEIFEKYDAEKVKNEKVDKKLNLAGNLMDDNNYYAIFHKKDGQKCLLIFSPEERLVELIQKQYKRRVR